MCESVSKRKPVVFFLSWMDGPVSIQPWAICVKCTSISPPFLMPLTNNSSVRRSVYILPITPAPRIIVLFKFLFLLLFFVTKMGLQVPSMKPEQLYYGCLIYIPNNFASNSCFKIANLYWFFSFLCVPFFIVWNVFGFFCLFFCQIFLLLRNVLFHVSQWLRI